MWGSEVSPPGNRSSTVALIIASMSPTVAPYTVSVLDFSDLRHGSGSSTLRHRFVFGITRCGENPGGGENVITISFSAWDIGVTLCLLIERVNHGFQVRDLIASITLIGAMWSRYRLVVAALLWPNCRWITFIGTDSSASWQAWV